MNISNASANLSLTATGNTTRPGYVGSVSINSGVKASYSTADQAYQTFFLLAGTTTAATLNMTTGDAAGDAWTAPVQQVETATAAGTVTGAGNGKATITAAGLTGSPLNITFAVTDEVAADWAALARTAIAANTDVAAMFDVSGTNTAIVLTRKAVGSYVVGSETIVAAFANDATLNIALDNDTSTGITTAATSANTTAGVAADGAYIWNDDIDFEGFALASPTAVYAVAIDHTTEDANGQTMNYTIGTEYSGRMTASTTQSSNLVLSYPDAATILDTLTMTSTSDTGLVTVTVVAVE